jgi:hypothetical protein
MIINPTYWFSAISADSLNETVVLDSTDSATTLKQQAEEWRRQARAIMQEALAMEAALKQSRSYTQEKKDKTTSELIERLFPNDRPLTPEAVAQVLRDEKWNSQDAEMVLHGLFAQAYGQGLQVLESYVASNTTTANVSNSTDATNVLTEPMNAIEKIVLETKMECLINGAEILDEITLASKQPISTRRWSGRVGSALRARRNELRKAHQQNVARQLVLYSQLGGGASSNLNNTNEKQQGQRETLSTANLTQMAVSGEVSSLLPPLWIPSTIHKYLDVSSSKISEADIATIKEKVLPGTGFFCTSTESTENAAIFRGNIRGIAGTVDHNLTAQVLPDIQRRLHQVNLAEKLQVFLLLDPDWQPSRDQSIVQDPSKPALLVIPADVVPDDRIFQKKRTVIGTALKFTAATLPILTTFLYSITCYALNPKFFQAVMTHRTPRILTACLPVFLGVVAVQVVHEIAHAIVARKWKMKIGLPFPLPSFQIGSFGCITPLRSFPQNRSALLDFALSGPLSAMLVSLGMMVAGIRLTLRASGTDILRFPVLPIAFLKSSFLVGSLLTLLAPKSMILPQSQPLPIHPLFMSGFAGMLSSALNMLPIFRLDGGRACSAAMGSRFATMASSGTLVFMFSLALSSSTGVAFAFGMLVVLFQRQFEVPTRDELTNVNDIRLIGWIGSLATAILALTPFPRGTQFM